MARLRLLILKRAIFLLWLLLWQKLLAVFDCYAYTGMLLRAPSVGWQKGSSYNIKRSGTFDLILRSLFTSSKNCSIIIPNLAKYIFFRQNEIRRISRGIFQSNFFIRFFAAVFDYLLFLRQSKSAECLIACLLAYLLHMG